MRKTFLLIISFIILIGCKPQKNIAEKIYKTTTGGTISVTETHPVGESLSTVVIQTIDFENNSTYTLTDIDPITNIVIADIDGNGFDEIYLTTRGVGSGSYASIIGYASNKDKSLTPINIPEISDNDKLFEGYMGHDTFIFHENKIGRQFPIYKEGDSNSEQTGGARTVSYLLKKGEASWQLKIDGTISEKVQIIRDCTGTYIRLGNDYKVCNPDFFEAVDSETMVNTVYKYVDSCSVEESVSVCLMYHESTGFVEVISYNH